MKRIAVLAGGPSCEREISLISGKAVADALADKGFLVEMIDPVGNFLDELKVKKFSSVFLALHGTFGEDGTIQRILEKEGIFYTGSGSEASERAFDKSQSQCLFKKEGLAIPEFRVIQKGAALRFPDSFALPAVVKPACSGSSVGVGILLKEADYEKAAFEAFRYSDSILVERYVHGRELTVGILADEPLPIVEVIAQRKFYDYEAKYKDSGTSYEAPAELSADEAKAVRQIALRAYKILGCEVMARVDIILEDGAGPVVLEVNTIPGLTGKSLLPKAAKAAGIDFGDLCVKILALSWEARRIRYGQAIKN